ncbi:MAG: trigger factor [Limisphaerales bacterium]
MNVTVENLAPCKKMLRVEVPKEKVQETYEKVTQSFQRQAALPGFRPGKVPREMVAKRWASDIEQQVKSTLTDEGYKKAVKDQNIRPVTNPDIEEIQFSREEGYQFAATVETAPEFDLPDYKGLAAKRVLGKVTDADVQRALTMLRERQTKFETVNREAKEGDVAVVNYKGTCEGKPIIELAPVARGLNEQKNFWVNMDKGSFIPGFADQLTGAKAGDKRTVNVDFPADFVTPQLQGKKGTYEVEVVEVKEKVLPELNDEFAKSYGAENLEKLNEGIRHDLEAEMKYKQESSVRDSVIKSLLEKVQTDLPETPVNQETRSIVYNLVNENQRRGVPKEAFDANKDQIMANAKATALERVKAAFLFGRIAEKENIKVEQADVVQRLQQMAMQYQMPADKLVKELQKNNGIDQVYDQALRDKVISFLVQHANIEEVAAEEQK